jgi:hypothetical protein
MTTTPETIRRKAERKARRLERLIKSIDRVIEQMKHADLRDLVDNWNGSPKIRENLIDFADWHTRRLTEGRP